MAETLLLTPVFDPQGKWVGIWLHGVAGRLALPDAWCEAVVEVSGRMRLFVASDIDLPTALIGALAPASICLVGKEGDAARSGMAERGRAVILHGKQFAADIDNQAQFEAATAQGVVWIAGNFFVRRPPKTGGAQDAGRTVLLKLMALVAQDADTSEIEQVFKREPGLSFNLFRLVNSAGMGLNNKISTLNQAIMVLGRRQLQRWIQLLLYASKKDGDGAPSPLLLLAAMRGRLMECMAVAAGWEAARAEQAFMAGIFSLLDVLLSMPMEEIIKVVALPEIVKAAVLQHEGELGAWLAWVEGLQAGSEEVVLMPSGWDDQLPELQIEAVRWATDIGRAMG